MVQLDPKILNEVCMDFIEDDVQKDLKKFVLTGKQCFLAYVDILKTVDEIEFDSYGILGVSFYYTPPDWVQATFVSF